MLKLSDERKTKMNKLQRGDNLLVSKLCKSLGRKYETMIMEKYINYAERTGKQVSCTGYYSITPSDGRVEATIYRGDKALDKFSWPLRDPAEIHRNKLMAQYTLKSGFDD